MTLKYRAQNILIKAPNWVGDAVMATPAFRCMRHSYPDARISVLLRPYVRDILSHSPWFDEVIEYEPAATGGPSGWQAGASAFLSTVHRLRRRNIDLALLLTHSFRSALLARLAGARYRVANSRGDQSWLLTDSLPWPRENGRRVPLPKVTAYLRLCRHLGCPEADNTQLQLHYSTEEQRKALRLIRESGGDPQRPMFAIVPGAAFGASKFWSTEKFAAVADAIATRRGWQPALLCGPGEQPLAEQIKQHMKVPSVQPNPEDFGLDVLKPFVARCRLMVATDTGPRHVAEAFHVPTVVIMGPTDPRHTETNYAARRVIRVDVPCGPCHLRTCPTDHRCMKRVTPQMVIDAAEGLLEEGAS